MKFATGLVDKTLAFVLRYILRYRKAVIEANLVASFTYTDKKELKKDTAAYYAFLAKTLRQVLVVPGTGLLRRRMHMAPSPLLDHWLEQGKSVVVTFGHTGNWEWTGSYLGLLYPGKVCALYKKISTSWVNALMLRRRSTHVDHLIEIRQMGELLRLMRQKAILLLMIADQNPGNDQGIIWTSFLNRKTAFVNGPESLALRFHLPVVYLYCVPHAESGGYRLTCHTLYDGQEAVPAGEITRRYAAMLEENIREHRPVWLWSHRRWKRNWV